ncbi:3-succinoylsemialdehyde-pyridine dehydrogenase [Burkholderia pseudomultivorans]|uniref:aldehyde dehydrogenase (NAD(+)) n=1 Tax=Burkholderia pseudomultivorans TaxID=1207504 RepID=A0A6P2MZA4_9BURK|nr:3-succinoylsemialdehyde-pyridine dehydrogenase [Burkholderia pseudomultivorans]MDR8734711.1 3-succinoylsemialdehyde-pyridine dehydrogenase [Burkholderia pseudomultivorans]MDR8740677.1 3-succinoylsemialdehyde-pyridine dehydrogenase [Burkholderia pseudomultivorans]MDR8751658.1 3-succinoylsemialdehyde-pyridine dehydrogenase [Burkholderia pseudomultivorans]MDR8777091.1 3-succinoylsemialdehyde-pyridine dehydrogenase [Burkholderia pseudomultivorans]
MVKRYDRFFIGGQWVAPHGGGSAEVVNPATEAVIGVVPLGDAEDAGRAVAAAKAAFAGWSATPPRERSQCLQRALYALSRRAAELARLMTDEVGTPISFSRLAQTGLPVASLGSASQLAAQLGAVERLGNSEITKEPVGVVACITPWNYPLHQIVAKVAPALAAGCTVVVKPSEVAPLNAFVFAEIIESAGFPPGVFNLVSGLGNTVGEALVSHPDVDMVSFTGSTAAGRRVSELASGTVKRVALELGGKSACIVLDDADFDVAIPAAVQACFVNAGQTCAALTRLLVPEALRERAEKIAVAAAASVRLGAPQDEDVAMGPLVSATQRQRVRDYIALGVAEGAELLVGGADAPDGLETGYYVRPTIFGKVRNEMRIAQEEIFGPVLSIIPYKDDADAVRIANDSPYGLGGGVWSGDLARARRVAARMRTGQVEINGGKFNPLAPFGGFKQSGNGRELGAYGLAEYLETKSLQLP